MHAPVEAKMGNKPALQPKRGDRTGRARHRRPYSRPAARRSLTDPESSSQDAVHEFRRAMKEWRALMRLMEPFIPDAPRWRHEARDHARSLSHARDGQRRSTRSTTSRQGHGAVGALDRTIREPHRGDARQRGSRRC